MKVTEVKEVQFKAGGSGWKTSFEETDKVLWTKTKPDFEVEDDIPEDDLEVNQKGNFQLKGQFKGKKPPFSGKPPRNDDDILLSVAFKGAIELERHHIVPAGKIDAGRVVQATHELYAGLLLLRPKKEAQ